jgi:hypothetical protein
MSCTEAEVLVEEQRVKVEKYSNNKTSGFRLLDSNMGTLDGNICIYIGLSSKIRCRCRA